MIELSINGFNEHLQLQHLVLDFNGTLAIDGKLKNNVYEKLNNLSERINVHILTGNTFNTAEEELKNIYCKIKILPSTKQVTEKGKYIRQLIPSSVISIGNGRNDCLMLKISAIGILVIQKEGASAEALSAADIICTSIYDALDLINNPLRLTATLRN